MVFTQQRKALVLFLVPLIEKAMPATFKTTTMIKYAVVQNVLSVLDMYLI